MKKWFGKISYREAQSIQEDLHKQVCDNLHDFIIMGFEPAETVLTLGKNAGDQDILNKNFPIIQTDRGGKVTAHLPGQLVCYPIFDLRKTNWGPRKFVTMLESSVIALLKECSISNAHTDSIYPGVWVGGEKICALGIRFKDHVSMHGFALNISCDLSVFESFIPCGIQDRSVTSIEKLTGKTFSAENLFQKVSIQ